MDSSTPGGTWAEGVSGTGGTCHHLAFTLLHTAPSPLPIKKRAQGEGIAVDPATVLKAGSSLVSHGLGRRPKPGPTLPSFLSGPRAPSWSLSFLGLAFPVSAALLSSPADSMAL